MRFLANRAEMLNEHAIDEFIRASALLSKFAQRESMNRRRSSYGLKHDAERMSRPPHAPGFIFRSTRNALSNC